MPYNPRVWNLWSLWKMRPILVSLLVFVMGALPVSGHAKDNGWTRISTFEITSKGELYIDPTNAVINPAGCKKKDAYALGKSHEAFTQIYALVLSAYRENAEINLAISGSKCTSKRPRINGASAR
jgi:hypothetical protein